MVDVGTGAGDIPIAAQRLARRPRLGDLVVGATGNFVPARALFAPHTLLRLLW